MTSLLHYRAWQGEFRAPVWSAWPIARVALGMLLRRRLFWVLYGFGLLLFLMFFFGSFLLAWAISMAQTPNAPLGRVAQNPQRMLEFLQRRLDILNGSRETFQYFFAYQGGILVVTLALAGAVLVGNDFTFRSLPFYLAKPIARWHYVLGKCLAVAAVVLLMTAVPALVLYGQHALDDWDYLLDPDYFVVNGGKGPGGLPLLLGVVGYGMILAAFLSVLLVAAASAMRRTMPLIMVWVSAFFFPRLIANVLVDGLRYDYRWRLIDLWNDLGLLGQACLGYAHRELGGGPQPEFWQAALVLTGVMIACLIYLNRRTRAVEIVR